MASTSCNVPQPIVDWGGGTAPTLKYNLPQGTTLTPMARVPLAVALAVFKPATLLAPRPNFWDDVATLQTDNLGRDMVTDILQNVNSSVYIKNIKAVTLSPSIDASGKSVITVEGGGGLKSTAKAPLMKSTDHAKLKYKEGEEFPAIALGGKEISVDFLVRAVKQGMMPVARRTFGGTSKLEFVKRPVKPVPRLYILEEYRINSYLGDYGAGKILKTFTLLPGEKTTITMRTFKQMTSKQVTSQNVLESVSSEVVDSLDTFIQDERQSSASSAESSESAFSADVSASADVGFASASADVGYSSSSSTDESRADAVNSLSNSMDKHTAQSNTNREINVNSSTEDSSLSETEETIVRNLENINYSRVLNFVFRQMQQQYISVTTLNNIKVLYTNGYPESVRVVNIEKLHDLLEQVILPANLEATYEQIIDEYCKIMSFAGTLKPFLTNITYDKNSPASCTGSTTPNLIDYWTAKGATDSFTFLGAPFEVPGIILDIKQRTLQTDSAVCDALLGQMDALDCFNMKLQDSEASKANSEAEIMAILKDMLTTGTPANKIEMAKIVGRLMSNCCDVPQSTGGCGCDDTPPVV